MKTATLAIALALLTLSFTEVPGHAQNRNRRSRSEPAADQNSQIEMTDTTVPEALARIFYGCPNQDMYMPAVEVVVNTRPMLCGKAISLPKPSYPPEAKAKRAHGTVVVKAVTDETGKIVWAQAVRGHRLLRRAAVSAACNARFSPETLNGRAVKALHQIYYNFQL